MSGENSCFSRFLVKFVEVSAAGLATAISAYALAHLGGLLPSSTTPTSAPATAVQVSPTASEVAEGLRAKPTPPAAAAAVNKQSPAPQQDTDAPVAQPARKAVKDAKTLPSRKHTKTDASMAEKEPRGQKSAEALARAALANVDANRPAPADALSALLVARLLLSALVADNALILALCWTWLRLWHALLAALLAALIPGAFEIVFLRRRISPRVSVQGLVGPRFRVP